MRFEFPRTRIDANGPSLRLEGDSYSFKSSIVKLTIEIRYEVSKIVEIESGISADGETISKARLRGEK